MIFRRYNSKDHPIAFHKAVDLGRAPKKIAAAGPAPDLEEAFEVSNILCSDLQIQDNKYRSMTSYPTSLTTSKSRTMKMSVMTVLSNVLKARLSPVDLRVPRSKAKLKQSCDVASWNLLLCCCPMSLLYMYLSHKVHKSFVRGSNM
jgi:hypothetical protein